MKSKKIVIIIVSLAVLLIIGGIVYAAGMGKRLTNIFVPADEADEFEAEFSGYGTQPERTLDPYTEMTTSDKFKAIATEEQKEQLRQTKRYDFLGTVDQYEKRMLQILGEIPEDTPYLTREKAVEILAGIDPSSFPTVDEFESAVIAAFNESAVAPEFDGGSGFHIVVYFTDAEPTGYIRIRAGVVDYHSLADGTVEVLSSIFQ
ncbi:MAG: hypothetical protein II124_01620 [Clostridia bacterium]|jgi:hypothetical protein|nr:hypothetical protein [Clostridia bacterium]MBQ4341619.1 hypothetical protein [Clostridia bacterium]MBR6428938.1 hypothetical protein [Clostridia bacterium]